MTVFKSLFVALTLALASPSASYANGSGNTNFYDLGYSLIELLESLFGQIEVAENRTKQLSEEFEQAPTEKMKKKHRRDLWSERARGTQLIIVTNRMPKRLPRGRAPIVIVMMDFPVSPTRGHHKRHGYKEYASVW